MDQSRYMFFAVSPRSDDFNDRKRTGETPRVSSFAVEVVLF